MDKIKALLEEVSGIVKKHNDKLDADGGRFNVFSLCGIGDYETKHSKIIAEFLNPTGSHGFKNAFLDAFIKSLPTKPKIDFDTKTAKVRTEARANEADRIDIFMEDSHSNIIIIENKINAGDQDRQLIRYDTELQKRGGKYKILYLTLDGRSASDQSAKGIKYTPISYKETIRDWLSECIEIALGRPAVQEPIKQYLNHIKTRTNQNLSQKMNQEIIRIIGDNWQSYEAILNVQSDVTQHSVTSFEKKITNVAQRLNFSTESDLAEQGNWKGIQLKNSELERNNLQIAFQFQNVPKTSLYLGFLYKNSEIREKIPSQSIKEKLKSNLRGKGHDIDDCSKNLYWCTGLSWDNWNLNPNDITDEKIEYYITLLFNAFNKAINQ